MREQCPRKYISLKTKRELLRKAAHSCEYEYPETKHRCHSCYQLQIDHIIPLAKGGSHDKTNLRVLCAAHNRHEARKWGLADKTVPPKDKHETRCLNKFR